MVFNYDKRTDDLDERQVPDFDALEARQILREAMRAKIDAASRLTHEEFMAQARARADGPLDVGDIEKLRDLISHALSVVGRHSGQDRLRKVLNDARQMIEKERCTPRKA